MTIVVVLKAFWNRSSLKIAMTSNRNGVRANDGDNLQQVRLMTHELQTLVDGRTIDLAPATEDNLQSQRELEDHRDNQSV